MNPSRRELTLGIDVGGTFTDACLAELTAEGTRIWTAKVPTTPKDRTIGFLDAVDQVLEAAGETLDNVDRLLHGTTVATNAILEQTGAATALVTTSGFRYVVEIGRHDVPREANVYTWAKPRRPVSPRHIFEFDERIDASGAVLVAPKRAAVEAVIERIRMANVEAVAIVLLHSYANPSHEQLVKQAIEAALPEVAVTASSDVLPVYREYERSIATMLNAYLLPAVGTYLTEAESALKKKGLSHPPLYMQSNGGVAGGSTASQLPIRLALSGPAAGVNAAAALGRQYGNEDVISIDIGGTSADVGIVRHGEPRRTVNGTIGPWPLPIEMLDIETVGAGGGSIARLSEIGALEVGPRSAGAFPGPAAYGRGGLEPTVTDANLAVGFLDESLMGGDVTLSRSLAVGALHDAIAKPLGIDVETAALGILEMVNANMVAAIRRASVERGLDPRQFGLMALGGAGALHACRLAELLDISTVIVPPNPGVLSAFGLVHTDLKNHFALTVFQQAGAFNPALLEESFGTLESQAMTWFAEEGIPADNQALTRLIDLRYENQGFELTIPLHEGVVDRRSLDRLVERFHLAHESLYTFNLPGADVEITTLRLLAKGRRKESTERASISDHGPEVDAEPISYRSMWFSPGESIEVPVYQRQRLSVGQRIEGPCAIVEPDTTTVVAPTWDAVVGGANQLVLRSR